MSNAQFHGHLAVPQNAHSPGILVLHIWWELTGSFQSTLAG